MNCCQRAAAFQPRFQRQEEKGGDANEDDFIDGGIKALQKFCNAADVHLHFDVHGDPKNDDENRDDSQSGEGAQRQVRFGEPSGKRRRLFADRENFLGDLAQTRVRETSGDVRLGRAARLHDQFGVQAAIHRERSAKFKPTSSTAHPPRVS
jgi:hypothetical protein